MASETTFTSKKIDYWTKVASIIMIVGKFQGGEMPVRGGGYPLVPPPLNKSLGVHSSSEKGIGGSCCSVEFSCGVY